MMGIGMKEKIQWWGLGKSSWGKTAFELDIEWLG